MNKVIKTILIISVIVFGVGFLLINSAQAGVIQFDNKQIFVDFDDLPFNLSNWAPGMSSSPKTIAIANNENFDINLYFKAKKTSGDNVLADVLTIIIDSKSNHLSDLFNNNVALNSVNSGKSQNYNIAISFDQEAGNEYQGKTINFDFVVIAEQIGKEEDSQEVIIPGGGYLPPGLTILDETVKMTGVTENSVTIIWTTSYSSTSQVIYAAEGEKHTLDLTDNTGTPPKYGYEHTTPEYDVDSKVTSHSVTITGLSSNTKYYFRVISHASPPTISREYSFTTLGVEIELPEEEILPPEEEITPFEEIVEGEIVEKAPEDEGEVMGPEVAGEMIEEVTSEEGEEFEEEEVLSIGERIRKILDFPGDLASMLTANLGEIWKEEGWLYFRTILLIFLLGVLAITGRRGYQVYMAKKKEKEEKEKQKRIWRS